MTAVSFSNTEIGKICLANGVEKTVLGTLKLSGKRQI